MIDRGQLVSVVVPARNAAKTIRETLHSISRQTYRALEVIVVDDGSTDETAAIVQRHSLGDPRFRVISKPNGGVASARNQGIRASTGDFVALIDADDLWHPTKIAKQVEALLSGGPDMALVYSPFRLIDADGRVVSSPHKYGVSGWVLHRHFHTNLVGNGSALLVRRKVLEEFGGFDPSLRRQGAEGCEDLLLQLRIAARYKFGEVTEYLVGYRRLPDNMSSNTEQMIRSGILAVNMALAECRDIPAVSASAMLKRYEWQRLKEHVRIGRAGEALRSFGRQVMASPAFVAGALWADLLALWRKIHRSATGEILVRIGFCRSGNDSLRNFYDVDPQAGIDLGRNTAMTRALRKLARIDQAYRPSMKSGTAHWPRSSPDNSSDPMVMTAFAQHELGCSSTSQKGC
jgi:glycosyltransferase involved in cell wall biosynthesis